MDKLKAVSDARIDELAHLLSHARAVTVFTGAGISTESGIADFRSPGGIWTKMQPIQYQDFLDDEETRLEDWRRRFHFQKQFDEAPINVGHECVAQILNSKRGAGLITQNIDGLHQRSGVRDENIIEIHGNGTKAACLSCKSPMTLMRAKEIIEETGDSPRCLRCNGLVKAAVISFGQPMPQEKMLQANHLARECDLFLVLGSSLVVQPAASLPVIAANNGAKLAIINNEPTSLDGLADVVLNNSLGEVLEKVLEKTVGC